MVQCNIKIYSNVVSVKLFLKRKRRCFHNYSELEFYFTGQDTANAGQKQSSPKQPIQVKGKEILSVLELYCCLLVVKIKCKETVAPLQLCKQAV